MDGYFIAPDAFNDVWVWRERGEFPVPVLARNDLRDDPELWAAIEGLVQR